MSQEKDNLQQDLLASFQADSKLQKVEIRPETLVANALRHQTVSIEDVYIRPVSTFQRSYAPDLLSIEKRERTLGNPYYYIDISREGLYDMLPEGLFHETLKKDAQIDTETAVEELEMHRREEKSARQFFLPLEQEFYRLQLLAEWQESNILLSSLNREQYEALIDLWNLPPELSSYQLVMMLYIIPLLHRVVGDNEATSNLLSLVMEVPIKVQASQFTTQQADDVVLPALGEFQLGKDSVLGNHIEDYHPNYRLIVGPLEKKYITQYLPGGKERKTLLSLCAFFLPCQSDISLKIEVAQEAGGFILETESTGEGYLGYTTHL
jgi:hypothetical protein